MPKLRLDDRGAPAVRRAFVEAYQERGWSVEQYCSDGLDVLRLIAIRPDAELRVDVYVRPSGGIDLGSVLLTPCGEEYWRSIIGRDWMQEPLGS